MQNQLLLDYEQTDENYIDHIQKVTKDDVISMANKAELDTIYVLTKGIILNEETYYELIDERVFEHELTNGLRLFVIPKMDSKRHL